MTKMHAFLMLLFCFPIAAATKSAFISDGTFIKSGKFALNKVKSCMIGTSFKIKVACGKHQQKEFSTTLSKHLVKFDTIYFAVITKHWQKTDM